MKRSWLVVTMVFGLLVTACSSGAASTAPSAAPTTAATAAPTAAPSATPAPPTAPPVGKVQVGTKGDAASLALTDAEKATVKSVSSGKLVGIVAATMATDYHAKLNNTIKTNLEALGFTVEICDTQTGDAAKAVTCFEGFMQKKAYGIVTASSAATVGKDATTAIAAGTIVIQVTGLDLGAVGAVSISVDNITIGTAEGKAAGEFAAATYPGAETDAIILDYPTIPDLVARADAIQAAMLAADPKVKVVGRYLGGLPANGATSMEQANTKYGLKLKLVTGINDGGNLGAFESAKTLGRTPDNLAFFGIDCDPAAVTAIRAASMYKGCVDTNPTGTGELAANAIGKLTAGQNVAGTVEVPVSIFNGK
jgi:ribose transport system substrate-binding protein